MDVTRRRRGGELSSVLAAPAALPSISLLRASVRGEHSSTACRCGKCAESQIGEAAGEGAGGHDGHGAQTAVKRNGGGPRERLTRTMRRCCLSRSCRPASGESGPSLSAPGASCSDSKTRSTCPHLDPNVRWPCHPEPSSDGCKSAQLPFFESTKLVQSRASRHAAQQSLLRPSQSPLSRRQPSSAAPIPMGMTTPRAERRKKRRFSRGCLAPTLAGPSFGRAPQETAYREHGRIQ